MPNVTLVLWGSVSAVPHRRNVLGETVGPHLQLDGALQRRFRILERAFAGVIAENGFDTASDEACVSDGKRRAKCYLRSVVSVTGGTQTVDGYIVDVGNIRFHLRDRYVRRLRDSTDPKCGWDETCFYSVRKGMPRSEEIASALLQLKNNPRLFDKWAMQNGLAFKADGQVFFPCAMTGPR